MKISKRLDYSRSILLQKDLAADPFTQFGRWFHAAKKSGAFLDANAMCLSTVDTQGYPDGRIVLLKEFDAKGFAFYTNLNSPKGLALKKTPRAALTFYWDQQERQIRIQGGVVPVSAKEADAYFASRPRLSQIGAWASPQSQPLENHAHLLREVARYAARFDSGPVPRPPHWSGFRLKPLEIEFWQGRPNRLHHRFVYKRRQSGSWSLTRLNP